MTIIYKVTLCSKTLVSVQHDRIVSASLPLKLCQAQKHYHVTMSHQSKELEDMVHRTCRFTAGLRAVELMRNPQNPIIRDELAVHLAGEEAIQRLNAAWDRSAVKLCFDGSELDPNKPQHSYFAGRARLLDDRMTTALQQLQKQTSATASTEQQQQQQQQQQWGPTTTTARPSSRVGHKLQVVSLGCGLDSRPWRLEFPGGSTVSWVDVDQQPVLDLKAALLLEAGAEVPPQQQQQRQPIDHAAAAEAQQNQQQPSEHDVDRSALGPAGDVKYPLKCSSYSMVTIDLTSKNWLLKLQSAGFEAATPTIWVPEGLLYYMGPEHVMRLLIDIAAAAVDTPSIVIASHIPLCNLDAARNAPEEYPLKHMLKSCVDDLDIQQLRSAGWDDITISDDLGVILKEDYAAQVVYPNGLEYSRGKPLEKTQVLMQLSRGVNRSRL